MKKQAIRTSIDLIFGLGCLLLSLWSRHHPAVVERYYSRGIFLAVRIVLDHTVGLLPFPVFYVFWAMVLLFWVFQIKNRPALPRLSQSVGFWGLKTVGFFSVILGLFFMLWGFNYNRTPVAEQLNLIPVPLDSAALWDELRLETHAVDSLRQIIKGTDTTALNDQFHWPVHAEDTVRAAVQLWLQQHGFPSAARVRGRVLHPDGLLLAFGAAGLYWPFVGEGNVDAGLHPLQTLPVMAHEMSHGFGFGDEGICNFIAYVACFQHPNPYIAYTNRLTYWRTVASNCQRSDPERYKTTFYPFIPAGIRQDVRAIYAQMDKYEELMPRVRYQVYDSYLKSQGIAAGMLNYDQVMMLVRAYRVSR